ncbi:MAG: bifunctional riboflavin kinase/FAD synthetase [Anaerolineae bacterium]
MSLITELSSLSPDRPVVLTVGKFDGVHIGHQHLLARLRRRAAELGAASAAMILHPNPVTVVRPGTSVYYLTTLEERVKLLCQQGLDYVLVQEFTREFSQTTADDFIAGLLQHMRLVEIWEGPAFALGRGRQGTVPYLRAMGERLGFTVHEVSRLSIMGETVSTSLIRRLLGEDDIAQAAWLLGRPHAISGPVIHGAKRGRDLGFPTANLDIPEDIIVPGYGVYAVRCKLGDEWLDGVASIGVRPTFDHGPRSVEVYLLDFDRQIYGETLRVDFIAYLRPELRFEGVQALIDQMGRDIENGRAALRAPIPLHLPIPDGNLSM